MKKNKGRIKKYLLVALIVIFIGVLFDLVITKVQASKIPHRFASKEEGKEIMLANTDYYNNYSQNDIDFRMQKTGATLDELLEESKKSVQKFNIFEKIYIDHCFAKMQKTIRKNGFR